MNYTPYTREVILNWLKGTAFPTLPTPHAALFDGSMEVTNAIRGAGRLPIAFNAPENGTLGRKIIQSAEVNYGAADNATDVDAVIIMNAAGGTNELISLPRSGGVKSFSAGAVVKINGCSFETEGDLENSVKDSILNWLRGNAAASAPAGLFVALYNGSTEVTTTIRPAGRVAVTLGGVTGGTTSNSAAVDFGEAAGAATVDGFRLFTAASGGTALTVIKSITPASVGVADELLFPINSLTITIDPAP